MKIGYHLKEINKGQLGNVSKLKEEIEEFEDALVQDCKLMAMVELSDIYGALEALAETYNLTMQDLAIFSDITKRAFINGVRT